jgi:hypothetical protein
MFSLFLAHVADTIQISDVCNAFHTRKVGLVERIEWIENKKQDGTPFKTCFVFFRSLYDTPLSRKIRSEISKGGRYVEFFYQNNSSRGPYWKLYANTSTTVDYPPNMHVDLEMLVDPTVSPKLLEAVVEKLDLGKILKITRTSCELQNKTYARVQFEYWHRNPTAVQFQNRLFDAPRNSSSDSSDGGVRVCVNGGAVLSLYAMEASNEGINPFIWVNPQVSVRSRVAHPGPFDFSTTIEIDTTSSETPSEVVSETPSEVVSETPSEVVSETPSEVVSETPSEVVSETPSEVVSETPSEGLDAKIVGSVKNSAKMCQLPKIVLLYTQQYSCYGF